MIHIIDICIVLFGLCFILHGVLRGFVREVIAFIGLFASAVLSFVYAPSLLVHLTSWMHSQFVAFIICFVVGLFLFAVLGELLSHFLRFVGLSFFNAVLGGLFGFFRTVCWLLLILCFLRYFQLDHYPVVQESLIFHGIAHWRLTIMQYFPQLLSHWAAYPAVALSHVTPLVRI